MSRDVLQSRGGLRDVEPHPALALRTRPLKGRPAVLPRWLRGPRPPSAVRRRGGCRSRGAFLDPWGGTGPPGACQTFRGQRGAWPRPLAKVLLLHGVHGVQVLGDAVVAVVAPVLSSFLRVAGCLWLGEGFRRRGAFPCQASRRRGRDGWSVPPLVGEGFRRRGAFPCQASRRRGRGRWLVPPLLGEAVGDYLRLGPPVGPRFGEVVRRGFWEAAA